jgi:hypothetical protein
MKLSLESYGIILKFGAQEGLNLIKQAGFDCVDMSYYWQDEKRICKNNIANLEKEKKSLGLFKIKEKNAFQDKIDNETQKLNGIVKRMENETNVILRKITTLQSRIGSIEKELKKPR